MNKKQYIFLLLMIILLYLSFKIVIFEFNKYKIYNYIQKQKQVVNNINLSIKKGNKDLDYINTKAFKNKILKSENGLKMKGEKVIILTSEKKYKKFSGKSIINKDIIYKNSKRQNITSGMTNFEKWIYILLNKKIK